MRVAQLVAPKVRMSGSSLPEFTIRVSLVSASVAGHTSGTTLPPSTSER